MNTVLETIKNRRSVRSYKEEQIKQEELDLIIEGGIYAPTACNDQPWHFTIIQDKNLIKHINDKAKEAMAKSEVDWIRNIGLNADSDITYNAPTLVIVSGRQDAVAPLTDCSAAIQNMIVVAESLCIGSVWLGLIRSFFEFKDEVKKLNIPEGYEPYYGVCFGYKSSDKKQEVPRRNRNVVNYIR